MAPKVKAQPSQWVELVTKSLKARLPLEQFEQFAFVLSKKNPRGPDLDVLHEVLKSRYAYGVDPLVPLYVEYFIEQNWVNESDLLQALLGSFKSRIQLDTTYPLPALSGHLEEALFSVISIQLTNGKQPATQKEAQKLVTVITTWLNAAAGMGQEIVDLHTVPHEALTSCIAAVSLTISLLSSLKFRTLLESATELKKNLRSSVHALTPFLSQLAPQLAHRLEYDTRGFGAEDLNETLSSKLGVGEFQLAHVADGPHIFTRAGFLIYLEAALHGWPTLDDHALLSYLQFRSKGDAEVAITELITTSIDLCSISVQRGDSLNESSSFRVFLVEKVPLLVLALSTMAFVPIDFVFLLTQVFNRPSNIHIPRPEFLVSCVVHGLVLEDNMETLLDTKSILNYPKNGKATREALIQEYRKDTSHPERFVERLGTYDGNSGAYAETVVEILHHLTMNRDTMSLRGLCNALASRPKAIDAIALFVSPTRLLNSLCQLLDGWSHEEDHSEYQPVYDELGACFLLIMACVSRFGLKRTDLGISTPGGFIERIFDGNVALAPALKELSDEENKHLTGWIRGLFETEGISDELMSACPPQDFIRLVPTIFMQIIIARRLNALDVDKLNNGLELLLEPFLLPSIVRGIQFLVQHLWERQEDYLIVVEILTKLLLPTNTSPTTHHTVVAIVARDVEQILLNFQSRQSAPIHEAQKLLDLLQPYLEGWRTTALQFNAATSAPADNHSSMTLTTLRQDFQSLCSWSLVDGNATAFTYSYSRTDSVSKTCGAISVLRALTDELRNSVQSSMVGEMALDIAASIICNQSAGRVDAQNGASRLTLQHALQLEMQDTAKLSAIDPLRAEILTRLGQRVGALLASIPSGDIVTQMPGLLDTTMELMEPAAVATAAITEQIALDDIQEQQPDIFQEPNLQEQDQQPGLIQEQYEPLQEQQEQQQQEQQLHQLQQLQEETEQQLQLQQMQQDIDTTDLNFGPGDNDFQLDIEAAIASSTNDDDIFAGLAFDTEMDFS